MQSLIEDLEALIEVTSRQVLKKLNKAGCKVVRQKGSHIQVKCPPNLQSTVPDHGSKDIKRGTLKSIEKSLDIDLDGDGRPKPTKRTKSWESMNESRGGWIEKSIGGGKIVHTHRGGNVRIVDKGGVAHIETSSGSRWGDVWVNLRLRVYRNNLDQAKSDAIRYA